MQGNWKDRLDQWAPEPPAGVWERLSDELAEAPPPLFAQKLHRFSAAPPPQTWARISAQLDAPVKTPIIALFSKSKLVRYGSAAASLLFCFFLFRQFTANNQKGASRTNLQQQTVLPLPGAIGDLGTTANKQKQTATPNAAPRATDLFFLPQTPALDKAPMPTLQAERPNTERLQQVLPAAAQELNDGYVERYIVMPVAEGVAVRLPKKLYDLFRCGELLSNADCMEKMASIRAQSAAPSFVSTADFPGVLEVVQQSEWRQ